MNDIEFSKKHLYMIENYLNFINEKLGVPEGNIESAKIIFDELLNFVKSKGSSYMINYLGSNGVGNNLSFDIKSNIEVGGLPIKKTNIKIEVIELNEKEKIDIAILGMSAGIEHKEKKLTHATYDKNLIKASLFINLAIKKQTTFEDFYNLLIKDKDRNIGVLSHEVKHIYDKAMLGKIMFADVASYRTWSDRRFGIKAIDEFIYYLYMISKAEKLVRSSEIAGEMISKNITKDEFKDFLESTTLYRDIKSMKDFSYEKMKSKLSEETDTIKAKLDDSDIQIPEGTDPVDFILKLTYENIVGGSIENLSNMMDLNNQFRRIFGLIKKEEEDYFNKFIKKIIYKTKEDYFEYCQKLINFEANKVLKKISKLYDMCGDKNVSKLQSKITDKSIVNPKLYDKYLSDTKIKNYESFFIKETKFKK